MTKQELLDTIAEMQQQIVTLTEQVTKLAPVEDEVTEDEVTEDDGVVADDPDELEKFLLED